MNKEYIEVKIPILDDVKEMEVVKTFNEEQLWYVCAIAKAFETKEKENTNLKQALNEIREYMLNHLDLDSAPELDYYAIRQNILQIIDKYMKED